MTDHPRLKTRPVTARLGALMIAMLAGSAGAGCVVSPKAPDGLLGPDTAAQAWTRLGADQRRLVEVMAQEACGECGGAAYYATWPVSRQTTFEAATHGLRETRLTDASGREIGRALDMIARVERVAGEEKGRRGDEQFRLYVDLVPEAREWLPQAREFFRDKDNTVFHKGYPINYRLRGRFPSVQVSVAEDWQRADIDVDYLSSRAPQGLFNGHLTSANSDVRVRGNDRRHARRWDGLVVWWKAVIDFLAPAGAGRRAESAGDPPPPSSRATDFDSVSEASAEFLADWFVRRRFDEALAFVSSRGAVCVNLDEDAENERGEARVLRNVLRDVMDDAVRGRAQARLSEAIAPVTPWDATWQVQAHPFEAAYTLARIEAADARDFVCGDPDVQGTPEFAQVLFQLRTAEADRGAILSLLWGREPAGWRLLSYDVVDP